MPIDAQINIDPLVLALRESHELCQQALHLLDVSRNTMEETPQHWILKPKYLKEAIDVVSRNNLVDQSELNLIDGKSSPYTQVKGIEKVSKPRVIYKSDRMFV